MSKSNGGLESYEIGVEDVRNKLSILNPNKSPGSDNLHPRILREMKNVLDKPLTMLYQETLITGMIPDDWKHAKVTAIFNKKARWLHAELCFSLYCQISGAFVAVPKRYN